MTNRTFRAGVALLLAVLPISATEVWGQGVAEAGSAAEVQARMAAAASGFLETLRGPRRARAHLALADSARTDWAYIPTTRAGLPLAEMTAPQRHAVHELLRSALSGAGYLKVASVMQLEEVLRAIETQGFPRGVEGYTVAIFGEPGGEAPWGWRFEGHHVSLNFTSVDPEGVSATPLFLGSNPAEVRAGTWTGLRVLAEEEDVARALLESLDAAQRARAIFSTEAPGDIVTRDDPVAREVERVGLPVAEMTSAQRLLLVRLLEVYAGTLEPAVAEARLAAIRDAGLERLHFGWAGSATRGEPHYYRIHGPTVLIEYDNVQNGANHVHSVWRDLTGDFGGDLLRTHYEHSPHHRDP